MSDPPGSETSSSDTSSSVTPRDGTEVLRGPVADPDRSVCVECGASRPARAEFCETCGAGADDGATIVLDVFADRDYFDTLDAAGLVFPANRRIRTLRFAGDVVNVGRRRTGDGARIDVDLSGDLADPGVSARHARFIRTPDVGWELTDVGSTNGTTVNESSTPIGVDSAVEVSVGDCVHLGAWTTIVVRSIRGAT